MKNLYNKDDNQQMVERISKLNPTAKAEWGKMSPAEMLFHCQQPIRAGLEEIKLKRSFAGLLFGKIAKKQVLSDKPFKKGLPTDKNFKPNGSYDFEKEKAGLIEIVSRLAKLGPGGITKEQHPFFGTLTPEEWNNITWKHLDHHLSQFGA